MTQVSGFQIVGNAPDYYERHTSIIMAPFVEAVIAGAGIRSGDSVLDVACGTGLATRRAAEIVGASGRVAGLDLNPGMLAKARSIEMPAPGRIVWHEGNALELPFADREFRAVICQQGVEFFPDLPRAAREMVRVLVPGGRVAVSFWAPLDDQTFMRAQVEGLRTFIGDAVASIAVAFDLAPATAVRAFESAGLDDVVVEKVVRRVSLPPLEEFAIEQIAALPVGPAFGALPLERREAFLEEMKRALAPHRTAAGGYDCLFASWVVTGSRRSR